MEVLPVPLLSVSNYVTGRKMMIFSQPPIVFAETWLHTYSTTVGWYPMDSLNGIKTYRFTAHKVLLCCFWMCHIFFRGIGRLRLAYDVFLLGTVA